MTIINIRHLKWWIPEIYVLASVIYYWVLTGMLFNVVAIGLLLVVAILIWSKNKALGMVFGMAFLLLNLYMVLAMISELNEFPSFNEKALILLLVGSAYLGLNIFMAIRMLLKWDAIGGKLTPQR